MIEPLDPYNVPDVLYDFAFIPHFEEVISELASIADSENWEYKYTESQKQNPILHNYITYTYARIAIEKKIAVTSDEKYSCWNTGLVTSHQESIYILFEENKFTDRRTFWHFSTFFKQGEYEAAKFSQLPDMAHYFDDPSVLIFDTRKEIRKNIDHIVRENRERFPDTLKVMKDFALTNILKGAIDSAVERVKRNYKTAIPQYYRGGIQLLLPLCLTDPAKADLALVIERFPEFYRASTCLTLDMAYNNARQLATPDRDWLNP